jgi:hypothetical protein
LYRRNFAPGTIDALRPRRSFRRHAFVDKLLDRGFALRQLRESHSAQHIRRFSELNIIVPDYLYAVAPGVEKVEKRPREELDARVDQCLASCLFVIDDKAEVTPIVGGLCTALLERKELVSQIDERHGLAFASKFEVEQATVEGQSRFDVTDFESNMIETDHACLLCLGHRALVDRWLSDARLQANQRGADSQGDTAESTVVRVEWREKRPSVNSGGDIRVGRWRQFIVEVLVGAATVAIAFAAIGATAEPILGAVALVGIALILERDVPAQSAGNTGPQPLRLGVELESARPEPQATVRLYTPIVDATSV